MKLERLIRRLEDPHDWPKLRSAGEMLGNELPRARIELLREARAAIAKLSLPEDNFAAGYVAALVDILAAYEAAIEPDDLST